MAYEQAVEFLVGLRSTGAKFGLENTLRLCALAGHPERRLRFIHVAGTNGKGSTCAMLEAAYRMHGLRVGLFTSPHLISFTERIQINRHPICHDDVIRWTDRVRGWIKQGFHADHLPTFFEAVTVLALGYFAEQRCDLVVWETGLGGRLDSTNVVSPLVSVITNVQQDHQQWLGNTLEAIAAEKAGIIKPGVPVVTATADPGALRVIEETARGRGSPLTRIDPARVQDWIPEGKCLGLGGAHQRLNAALVRVVVENLSSVFPVSSTTLWSALANVRWDGRFQRFKRPDGGLLVIDSAHNPDGCLTLLQALEEAHPGRTWCFIFGVLADKDFEGILGMLSSKAHRILLPPVHTPRAVVPAELRSMLSRIAPAVKVETATSFESALKAADGEALVVVAGSMYLVGEALQTLLADRVVVRVGGERLLNDWSLLPPRN